MAFRSYDELISMASKNPKLAKSKVTRAQQSNNPVVDSDNSGYGEDYRKNAITKRLTKGSMPKRTKKTTRLDSAVETRMKKRFRNIGPFETKGQVVTPGREDVIVTNRKKVGY